MWAHLTASNISASASNIASNSPGSASNKETLVAELRVLQQGFSMPAQAAGGRMELCAQAVPSAQRTEASLSPAKDNRKLDGKQRWRREAYNEYMRKYMRRKRGGSG